MWHVLRNVCYTKSNIVIVLVQSKYSHTYFVSYTNICIVLVSIFNIYNVYLTITGHFVLFLTNFHKYYQIFFNNSIFQIRNLLRIPYMTPGYPAENLISPVILRRYEFIWNLYCFLYTFFFANKVIVCTLYWKVFAYFLQPFV